MIIYAYSTRKYKIWQTITNAGLCALNNTKHDSIMTIAEQNHVLKIKCYWHLTSFYFNENVLLQCLS